MAPLPIEQQNSVPGTLPPSNDSQNGDAVLVNSSALVGIFMFAGVFIMISFWQAVSKCDKIGIGQRLILGAMSISIVAFSFFLGVVVELTVKGVQIRLLWSLGAALNGGGVLVLIVLYLCWMAFTPSLESRRERTPNPRVNHAGTTYVDPPATTGGHSASHTTASALQTRKKVDWRKVLFGPW